MAGAGLGGTAERRERILGLVHERGDALVSELKTLFGVSEVTVRADLAALAQRGLLVRTHGGAAVPRRPSSELTFATREVSNVDLKRRIGLAAADLLQDGQSVVLDASTTALQIARAVRARGTLRDVTVITNGVHTALELLDRKSTRLNSSHVRISYAVFCLKKKKNHFPVTSSIKKKKKKKK